MQRLIESLDSSGLGEPVKLSTGMSKCVGLVLESDARRIVDGIYAYGTEAGWWCGLNKIVLPFQSSSLKDRWDGILALPVCQRYKLLDACICPIVEICGAPQAENGLNVLPDWKLAGEMGAGHLLERGFANLAFYRRFPLLQTDLIQSGFQAVAGVTGVMPVILDFSREPGRRKSQQSDRRDRLSWLKLCLAAHPKPVGIMVEDDRLAIEVMSVCRLLGLRIPQDVAVLGINNDPQIMKLMPVPLSSVEINEFEIGYRAAQILNQIMNGEVPPAKPTVIPPARVSVRESTDTHVGGSFCTRAAYEYIRHNFSHKITPEQIALHANVASRTLQMHFKREIGRTITEEITRFRLEHARKMLERTDLKISTIAQETGFASYGYFCRRFARQFRRTPGEHRQLVKPNRGAGFSGPTPGN